MHCAKGAEYKLSPTGDFITTQSRVCYKRKSLAEREGFEPPVEVSPHNCLAGSCLQPLGHLSDYIWGPVRPDHPPIGVVRSSDAPRPRGSHRLSLMAALNLPCN